MLFALCAAFLGGMILNFMPCVFPVVSLKAMGLVRHGGRPAQLRLEGLAFLGGVTATMLLLAGILVAARAGGAAIGWGFQLQSPLIIAILALVMVGAALNLAGLFEVGLAAQSASGDIADRGGAIGAGLTGALAIVVATPCSAPFMAGALGYALVQPPIVALAVFLALALGFAAPFTALSFVPALARRLPRPGAWMAIVKQLLAFPMLGAAAWLIWVLDQQAGPTALAAILGCAILLAFAAWIHGLAQRRRMIGKPALPLQALALAGIAVVAAGLAVLPGTTSVAPAAGAATTVAATGAAKAPAPAGPVAWSPEKLAGFRAQGKPIFVDFTASWCITCQLNDKAALSTAPVKAALARTGTVYMVADSTRYDPRIEQAMAAFDRGSLPLYVVYPAGGGEPVILPQILTPQIVVAALGKAAAGTAAGGARKAA